ncbi:type III-A CRISPR-associated protein Csm2 [Streptococcus iners]|uniref:CRISPR system Cms protein Csm2 n=1 Tax=Streptococcus iners TaxID=3028084 RepID=A0AA96VLC1_9STRE|nr:type III-A CRISPR-associated protein Csm2 [Streptococcus sp. 29887]MCK4025219.1 type III-A CRISPR-associated protein Csm2 [Streptococcus suis]WNY51283.1 type III-A CRISPR-associated protein Csm2 [Streptococcus sp. 29887]
MAILTDRNYVDKAEKAIKQLKSENGGTFLFTTSQLRNLLSLTSSLYDESKVRPFEELQDKTSYLRVQFVYQSGRNSIRIGRETKFPVKDLVERAEILECLKEVRDIETLQRFCRYMEALVAYFKYEGGKDR